MVPFVAVVLLLIPILSSTTVYTNDNLEMKTSDIQSSSRFLLEASRFFRPNNGEGENGNGTRWAVLIAGSSGWYNYRHQADICHAYQILKKGGLKNENIIVFMYDDIASYEDNPRPGIIINSPHGEDVYHGVPKDYTGEDVNVNNFLNVILANKSALTGGSGKVLESGPNDHIFIYYADHGSPGLLGMPNITEYLYANDLLETLKRKHASGTYKSMVFYLEACEAGSIFNGHLPAELNIYATTASNPDESSYAYYCTDLGSRPVEYTTCLGDLYSIAWMEDCDKQDTLRQTLGMQFERVRERTILSHVMEYGDLRMRQENLSVYMGTKPADVASPDNDISEPPAFAVQQRDADLVHFWTKFIRAPENSPQKLEAQKQLVEAMTHRMFIDKSMETIGKLLFGMEKGPKVLKSVRPVGQANVDDINCFKTMLNIFQAKCGPMSHYGMKHSRAIANICNAGIKEEQMAEASALACFGRAA